MMLTKEEARERIRALVNNYLSNKEKFQHDSETDTRVKFIDRMFEALGWDVFGEKIPDEVQREESVKTKEMRKKKADYTFRIGGISKVVVEAKSLGEDLSNSEYQKQAVEYAYNKACTWAVLTNFHSNLIFYVDRKGGKQFYRIDFSNITTFDNEFETLWFLSKDSITKNLLEIEVKRRGIAIEKVPIDQQLLSDLKRWRELLSNDIRTKYKTEYESDIIDEIVQRIIDRLIFVRKAEDAQLEDRKLEQIVRRFNKSTYDEIKKLFVEYRSSYDSKLFGESDRALHECDKIELSNDSIEKVIRGMYKPADANVEYNFAAIDADVLGSIYEQYLAYVLLQSQKKVRLRGGIAHRKEQGIYYTPPPITEFIVRNTLSEILKDRGIGKAGEVKVLDPACGSGSFLIKAFDVLNEYYLRNDKSYSQTKFDVSSDIPFDKKAEILRNNIYGVDLDARAVEISQLNLLMKIAAKGYRLPVLQKNIQCGDSLIENQQISEKHFVWKERFSEIMGKGGFDVVMGNPPYINAIQLSKTVGEKVKDYWKSRYTTAKGTYDIYILFFEKALELCKDGGYVSFITPNKWLSSPYGTALRKFILENYTLVRVVDLSRIRVFNDPSVYPIIAIIQKRKPSKTYTITTQKVLSLDTRSIEEYKISSNTLKMMPEYNWGIILSDNARIVQKIFENGQLLEKVATVQATSTAAEADEYSNYISDKDGVPIINTGTIDRYSTKYGFAPLTNKGTKLLKPRLDLTKVNSNRKGLYNSPKIIFAKIALRPEGFLDVEGKFASINTNCVHTPLSDLDLKYLAAVLNSKLMAFVYSELFSGLKMSGGYFQFQAPQLRILPIADTTQQTKAQITKLVDDMMHLNEELNKIGDRMTEERTRLEEEINRVDHRIDELVYRVYSLTEQEIETVGKV